MTFLFFLLSWALVAWGQPHISPFFSLLASSVGFALFWLGLSRLKQRRYIWASLWFFAVQLVQLSWLATPAYQGTYIFFVYGGIALWLGAEFGILALFFPKKGPLRFRAILGIAALWTLLEWSRLFILCGFAWNPVGLALTGFPISTQLASVVGVFGLSFIVMVVNLLAYNVMVMPKKRAISLYGGCLLLPYLFGFGHLQFHEGRKGDTSYNVALVQTALLPDEKGKVHPYLQWNAIFTYLEEHRAKDLDLIVLPEYALPFSSHTPVYPFEEMKAFVKKELGDLPPLLKEPLAEEMEGKWYVSNAFWTQAIANFYGAEVVIGLDATQGGESYNAAFHFTPNKEKVTRYDKRVLLPLAEYLPFNFLRPLVARYGISNFFTHGKEVKLAEGKELMSLSVCYEECFPHIMREGRKQGAKLFVNVTNDGWYPASRLPQQHFIHGRVRAVENGVPLVRACNTGITAGVDSLGRTTARFENGEGKFEFERGALFVPIDLYSFSTLYTFWGDAFIVFISLGCLLFLRLAQNRESGLS
ncbi:apolipoprotein N-acyltransferase [Candidatus Neptunochlamydia vexilliferae]|nr:apolipoprotein N-acyltransferase [Candidatus Neptunochlamydia vexilliferae]